jgi:hypothetical protein
MKIGFDPRHGALGLINAKNKSCEYEPNTLKVSGNKIH